MCNLSQGLKEEGKEEGRIEEQKNTILRLLKDGKGADIMAAATGWTIEHVQSFLKSQNLCDILFGVSDVLTSDSSYM